MLVKPEGGRGWKQSEMGWVEVKELGKVNKLK